MRVSAVDDSVQVAMWRAQNVSSLFGTSAVNSSTTANSMSSILANQTQVLTLSLTGNLASQANAFAIQSGSQTVMEGFQQAMEALYSQPLDTGSLDTLQTAIELGMESQQTFDTVFTTVNTLSERGMSVAIQPYLSAINTAYARSGVEGVSELSDEVVATATDSEATRQETLQSLTNLLKPFTTDSDGITSLFYNTYTSYLGTGLIANQSSSMYSVLPFAGSTSDTPSLFLFPVVASSYLNLLG